MGFLTTIMFRNDAYDIIKKNPKEVIENILKAMNNSKAEEYGISYDCNPMKGLGTSQADATRLFLQSGNSIYEVGGRTELNIEQRKEIIKEASNLIKWEENEIKRIEEK